MPADLDSADPTSDDGEQRKRKRDDEQGRDAKRQRGNASDMPVPGSHVEGTGADAGDASNGLVESARARARDLREKFGDEVVLIADREQLERVRDWQQGQGNQDAAPEVTLRTVPQHREKFGHDPTAQECNATCLLFTDEEGSLVTTPNLLWSFEVDKTAPPERQHEQRSKQFAAFVAEIGVPAQPHADLEAVGVLKGEQRGYATPAGRRGRSRIYREPLQAGQFIPDTPVRRGDAIVCIFPSLDASTKEMKRPEQLEAAYGKGNAWLKSLTFNSMKLDVFNRKVNSVRDAAGRAFAVFAGRPYENQRADIPKVLVRAKNASGKEMYISKRMYDRWLADDRTKANLETDLGKLDVLVLTRGGETYEKPEWAAKHDPDNFKETMTGAGFPESLANKSNRPGPIGLVRLSGDIFEPLTADTRLPPGFQKDRIFLQNWSNKVRYNGETVGYTGNYTSLAAIERKSMEITPEQKTALEQAAANRGGRAESIGAGAAAGTERAPVAAAPVRQYNDRSRGQTGDRSPDI
jgi:hypothetical protein